MVYVLDKNGQPLMPTNRHGKVKHLLDDGKAKVIRKCPFTIKLLYDVPGYVQYMEPDGMDTGSGAFGTAVINQKNEVVYMSEVTVRNDIKRKMDRRRKYRRTRRSRKTRYRAKRFRNRRTSRRVNRLSPTMVSKLNSHEKELRFIRKSLPIKRTTEPILETGNFDPHLMKNPALADPKVRIWGYQQGPNYGYQNTRQMVLARDKHKCQLCKGKSKCAQLEVHHIVFRSVGGSDEPENLITLCKDCHKDLHADKIETKLKGKKMSSLKHATQMNIIRSQLMKNHPNATETKGYITQENRYLIGLPKGHAFDACVIASGGKPVTFLTDVIYIKRDIAKGDYRQTNGAHSEKKIPTGKVDGFRKFDKVEYFGEEYFIKGRRFEGSAAGTVELMYINGDKVDFSDKPKGFKTPKIENCKRISARKSQLITTKKLPKV